MFLSSLCFAYIRFLLNFNVVFHSEDMPPKANYSNILVFYMMPQVIWSATHVNILNRQYFFTANGVVWSGMNFYIAKKILEGVLGGLL